MDAEIVNETTNWVLRQETIFVFMSIVIALLLLSNWYVWKTANAQLEKKDKLLADGNAETIATMALINDKMTNDATIEKENSGKLTVMALLLKQVHSKVYDNAP